mgnify:CR=1 FL=1
MTARPPLRCRPRTQRAAGFSLLELLLALSLLGLGLTLIASAFPVGLKVSAKTSDENRSANLASSTLTYLRVARVFGAAYRNERWTQDGQPEGLPPPPERPIPNRVSATSAYRLYRSTSMLQAMAIVECFLQTPPNLTGSNARLQLPGSSREFRADKVNYLFDHDGNAAPSSGPWTSYPFLHRRPRLSQLESSDSAIRQWAIDNERLAAAIQPLYFETYGPNSLLNPHEPFTNEGPAINPLRFFNTKPASPQHAWIREVQAQAFHEINNKLPNRVGRNYSQNLTVANFSDTENHTNNIFLWFPLSERIDKEDVSVGPQNIGRGNAVAGGRYFAQVFYRQVNQRPVQYQVYIAIQRTANERPFQLFLHRNQAFPRWALDRNVSWKVAGWALARPDNDNNPWNDIAIDETAFRNNATDSNTEALNRLDSVYGRIRLHRVSLNDDRVTSTGSITDGVTDFEPGLNPNDGGYLIDYHRGTWHQVIQRREDNPREVTVNPAPTPPPGGQQPLFWAIPSCAGVYTAIVTRQY